MRRFRSIWSPQKKLFSKSKKVYAVFFLYRSQCRCLRYDQSMSHSGSSKEASSGRSEAHGNPSEQMAVKTEIPCKRQVAVGSIFPFTKPFLFWGYPVCLTHDPPSCLIPMISGSSRPGCFIHRPGNSPGGRGRASCHWKAWTLFLLYYLHPKTGSMTKSTLVESFLLLSDISRAAHVNTSKQR